MSESASALNELQGGDRLVAMETDFCLWQPECRSSKKLYPKTLIKI